MKVIKHLADQIKEEVSGAKCYAEDALKYKSSDPDLAKLYFDLAETEYGHVEKLHAQAMKKIEEIKNTEEEIPEYMYVLWDDIHSELIGCMAEARVMLDLYSSR